LTDSNIIKDSITQPKFRSMNDIYQIFEMTFNYNIVSEFSEKFSESFGQVKVSETEGDVDLKTLCRNSRVLYNIQNIFKFLFKYHYESLPLHRMVVEFFAANVWVFKCEVSIDKILGTNPLRLMDVVSINSFFFTGGSTYDAFVVGAEPDLYNATVKLTLFMPQPPGQYGSLCDPVKDALTTERDTSGWTNENDFIRDAGMTGRAAPTVIDDAGLCPRGTISCEDED